MKCIGKVDIAKDSRIDGVININRVWLIPRNMEKLPKLKTGKHPDTEKEVNA